MGRMVAEVRRVVVVREVMVWVALERTWVCVLVSVVVVWRMVVGVAPVWVRVVLAGMRVV